jgi:phytoene dehydrogenase-like protein
MQMADRCLSIIEEYCPGFKSSILYQDVLSPLDLETIFGLHKGNIFHGSLALHQLAYLRPAPGYADYRTPIQGLYLCGSGTHPGGGVMGAPGRNSAMAVLDDLGIQFVP